MEELLEILQGMHPEIDFESCETLIDDDILEIGRASCRERV